MEFEYSERMDQKLIDKAYSEGYDAAKRHLLPSNNPYLEDPNTNVELAQHWLYGWCDAFRDMIDSWS